MKDIMDYMVIWAPVLAFLIAFLLLCLILGWKQDTRITNLTSFVRIFLSEGATLKTWGLFIAAFTIMFALSGIIAKVASASNLPAIEITFFKEIAIGLELLMSIVLASFGAVAFKGQLPGGANFQVNQDDPDAPSPPHDGAEARKREP